MDSGVPSPWWRHAGDDRFGPVLALLVASLVVGAVLPSRLSALSVAALGILLWLAVARAAGLSVRARRTGLVWFVSVSLVAGGAAATDSNGLRAAADLVLAAGAAALAVVITRTLLRERVVTISTVAGVLCLYLLIGVFFAQVYMGVADLSDDAFSAAVPLGRFALLYFSFISLTTVGFGDITPAMDLTRALAATEAVLGQLFLVTVVARVVALMGQARRD